MKRLAALLLIAAGAAGPASAQPRFEGLCDASAAVALDARHFIVADDERNTLVVYRRGEAQRVGEVDLAKFLKAKKESDLEGAAQLGSRIYWIASHARNSAGELREDRHRFFATEVRGASVEPVGRPYTALQHDLLAHAALAPLLTGAAQRAAEAEGGFNIEGLATAADGSLLIGLRSPVPQGKAIVVPLLNPAELVDGKGPARFGAVIRLDLGGHGVRSLERVGSGYLIAAGPTGDDGTFAVFPLERQGHRRALAAQARPRHAATRSAVRLARRAAHAAQRRRRCDGGQEGLQGRRQEQARLPRAGRQALTITG
ncbi:DUF3616 domain-containing protein [Roseateles asaccharophilus]|uniref:DUF3616 domain-containing protein n=1 Tax=Roseateles asaccharophilus TaxID=582607 RepID=A0ABU2A520_9BURK|nr:DUF3616 domain-containing protein [Roseateles asaccharophilus]MDR7332299.1 hypothetical protein [Roseateles asaccharophilus]